MKTKILAMMGAVAIVLPTVSFAQYAQPIMVAPDKPIVNAVTSCPMPSSPANASDWTGTVTCLQGRIDTLWRAIEKIENRLNALESRNTIYPTPVEMPPKSGGPYPMPVYPEPTRPIKINEGSTVTPASPSIQLDPSLKMDDVKAIQNFLKSEGSFTYPTATGYFGTVTKEALRKFQAKQGLSASGVMDSATLEKMKVIAPKIVPNAQTIQQITIPKQ